MVARLLVRQAVSGCLSPLVRRRAATSELVRPFPFLELPFLEMGRSFLEMEALSGRGKARIPPEFRHRV